MPGIRATFAAAVVGVLALVGCAGESSAPDGTPTTASPTTSVDVTVPDSAPGRATRWVLDHLAADSGPSESEAAAIFAPVFLAEIPAADLAAVFDQLRALGPFTLTGYSEQAGNAQATLIGAGGTRYLVSVSTDADERIQGLYLQPAPALPEIESLADAATAVEEAAEHSSFLLARVLGDGSDATCEPLTATAAETLRPIGSVFKLYVLGAVVDAVAAGDLAWEDTLTLTDDLRSLPSGTLHEEPAGTEVSVVDAAGAMIAISDNTATDMLIDAVGRDAVEAAVERMGHSEPEAMRPFLTTREMFLLAFSDAAARERWVEAGGTDPLGPDPAASERQRAVLDTLPAGEIVLDPAAAASSAPAWPEGLDWFASAHDVCRAHLALQDLATTAAGEPVREILSANPGLADVEALDYVAFKGGSAPGEIAGSWYAEADGEAYVVVVQAASTTQPAPDAAWLVRVAERSLALAAG